MSSATCVYNKLLTPTVRVNATKAGYAKLSWDKIKDAKKYGVYVRDHSKSKGNYYKLIKTVKGTSCTYKGTEDEDVYVRAIASNSKANSQYLKVYAQRYAPQPKIIGGEADKNDGTKFIVKVQIPYDCSDHESLLINLYRSDSKDGPYSLINCVAVYGIDYDARYYKDPNQFKKNKFNKDSVIKIPDYNWRGETPYYYKAETVKGVSNMAYEPTGLDSKIVKLTTPELPVVGEEFGTVGTLYRHTDRTLAYFVDNDGNKYTEGLELERFWEDYLEYTDNEGSKFRIYKDGRLMMYNVDSGSYEYVKEENNED